MLLCFGGDAHVVVDGPAVDQFKLLVEQEDVRGLHGTEGVCKAVVRVEQVGHGVARGLGVLLHLAEAVVAAALCFVRVEDDGADAVCLCGGSESVVAAFPAFRLLAVADDERAGVAGEDHEQALRSGGLLEGQVGAVDVLEFFVCHRGFCAEGELFCNAGRQGFRGDGDHVSCFCSSGFGRGDERKGCRRGYRDGKRKQEKQLFHTHKTRTKARGFNVR